MEIGLRDDVYRRPLSTALERLGVAEGWTCVDVGAGAGDVSVALAKLVGRTGRVYAVDVDPRRRDEIASLAAAHAQVLALSQPGEELTLPEPVDLAFCRFLLLHVPEPLLVLRRMAAAVKPTGWVVVQEPVTTAGRIGGRPLSMEGARDQDIGATLPALVADAGLALDDAWAEAPAGAGPGPVADYLEVMTGVHPGAEPVVLPPLVTILARPLGASAHFGGPEGPEVGTPGVTDR